MVSTSAIHRVKGRIRYKIEGLYRSQALADYLQQTLSQQTGVEEVKANSLTGNLLIKFDPTYPASEIKTLVENTVASYQSGQNVSSESQPQKTETFSSDGKDWHFLEIDRIVQQFGTSPTEGLSDSAIAHNAQQYGSNTFLEAEARPDLEIILEQFNSLPVALLGVAAGISLVTGGVADALTIAGVVGLNAVIGYVTESQSERIIQSLKSQGKPIALVIRNGREETI
ncbi:MAG: cation-transporting P-type ATPase, partial [Halothece sp. Uz-M2-17]|nr:cation-transporting P-type ATPase [Halothece sp. Uz-M2-17]